MLARVPLEQIREHRSGSTVLARVAQLWQAICLNQNFSGVQVGVTMIPGRSLSRITRHPIPVPHVAAQLKTRTVRTSGNTGISLKPLDATRSQSRAEFRSAQHQRTVILLSSILAAANTAILACLANALVHQFLLGDPNHASRRNVV